MDQKAQHKLYAARDWACDLMVYMSRGLYSMPIVECDKVPEVGADEQWRLYIDPDYVEAADTKALTSKIMNQNLALVLDHAGTAKGLRARAGSKFNQASFQLAGDLVRNEIIEQAGGYVDEDFPTPKALGLPGGKTLAEYYRLIEDAEEDGEDDPGGEGEDQGEGDGQGEGQGPGDPGQGEGQGDPGQGQGPSSGTFGGSCGDGQARDYEEPGDAGDGMSGGEVEAIRMGIAQDILEGGHSIGDMPGGLERFAKDLIQPPVVDWRDEFASVLIRTADSCFGYDEYNFSRPHRIQLLGPEMSEKLGGIVMPVMSGRELRVCYVVDSSGSMSSKAINAAMVELRELMEDRESAVRVIVCDTNVHDAGDINDVADIKVKGGGGTDMRTALEYVTNNVHPEPDIVIVITDCETPWPAVQPDFNVIILHTHRKGAKDSAWVKYPKWQHELVGIPVD